MKTTRRSSLALAAVAAWMLASGARAQEQQQRLEKIPGMTDEKAKSLAQQEAAALEKDLKAAFLPQQVECAQKGIGSVIANVHRTRPRA